MYDADLAELFCDVCGELLTQPATRGLIVFPHGDDVSREEPPLCEKCAHAIGITAIHRFFEEEEEG